MNIKAARITEKMVTRSYRDIASRSVTGTYIYLVIWFSIIIPHKFYATSPKICLWLTATFILLSAGRIFLITNFKRIYPETPLLWRTLFFSAIWMPALIWGMLCAATLLHPTFKEMILVFIVSTAGLTGGGVAALVPNRTLTVGLITAYLAPGGIALLTYDVYNPSVGIVFLVYWIGMYFVTKNQHREYWQSLNHSFLIKEYAADLERLNTLDGLTGLKNRKFFDQTLTKEMKRAIRAQSDLSLLFIDLDHFKDINDQHGHLVGDDCLRRVSVLFEDHVKRETDTVARYGGEEFAVILPNSDREQSVCMAENIRQAVEKTALNYGNTQIFMTVSIGVSSLVPAPETVKEKLIELADNALYMAKNNGRNQVRIGSKIT